MSERAAYWRGLVERQARSGVSIAEFCEQRGVSTASFYAWRKRLREQPHQAPLFVPVSVAAEAPRQGPAAVVEIERADGTRIKVFDGARRQLLEDVLAALKRQP